jgi:predicted metal-dependent enzyme (double-stranded beta helix superfamily)
VSDGIAPLRDFVRAMTLLLAQQQDEALILRHGRGHLAQLIADDGWLPPKFRAPRPDRYAQYLLHADALERFSVVSFVWQAGQCTPVHDHTVWGLVGVLRGAERCEEFHLVDGQPRPTGHSHLMKAGDIDAVSPSIGDWHRVSHAAHTGAAVSIHVYGGNIGALTRHCLDGTSRLANFVSGYDLDEVPNLWNPFRKH